MKKIIFGIFAHPDDEAFGPSGTLLAETLAGAELHLITLTAGDSGMNPDNHPDLAKERLKEWHKGGELMGAKSMHFLGFSDGCLCNDQMVEAGEKVLTLVKDLIKNSPQDSEIEFMSADLNGISGHIDHIVAGRAACWVFYKLKKEDNRATRIRLACVPSTWLSKSNIEWLYMEKGRDESEIDEVVDNRHLRDEIIEIMRVHHTQRSDGETHIKQRGDYIGINHFIVKT